MIAMLGCGKDNNSNVSAQNVQLLIANLSPDLYPLEFYVNNVRQGSSTTYSFNNTPAYFSLSTTNQSLAIRSSRVTGNLFRIDTTLRSDRRYSLFVVGMYADSTYKRIFLPDDTAAVAPIGKGGRLRFVNGSPGTTSFDVWANGTLAIKNIKFSAVSPYITLPAGSYTFRVFAAGTSKTELASTPYITIQDGRLYTLYSKGIPNRPATDSARLSLAYILNN
ncbi:DUF4397 domain-containing protein [Mucilaginibacter lacusdianchii]|uniref:DUF4397 domain-containing protein n=1 Tax=Mucilaginibacter lacusdianchii TaxID=2684211 RepID=UPI00131CAB91|nr:DUF4397 domain-containing protein [Mucilaginibacter sp. JXJ CY 39]